MQSAHTETETRSKATLKGLTVVVKLWRGPRDHRHSMQCPPPHHHQNAWNNHLLCENEEHFVMCWIYCVWNCWVLSLWRGSMWTICFLSSVWCMKIWAKQLVTKCWCSKSHSILCLKTRCFNHIPPITCTSCCCFLFELIHYWRAHPLPAFSDAITLYFKYTCWS